MSDAVLHVYAGNGLEVAIISLSHERDLEDVICNLIRRICGNPIYLVSHHDDLMYVATVYNFAQGKVTPIFLIIPVWSIFLAEKLVVAHLGSTIAVDRPARKVNAVRMSASVLERRGVKGKFTFLSSLIRPLGFVAFQNAVFAGVDFHS
jgi:hypothetical protein